MKTLFTDASFDHNHTESTTEPFVRGKIAIADGNGFARVEKVIIGKVPLLKQYINILELTAVARAIEIACIEPKPISLEVFTDSQVAMYWARAGKIKKAGIETEAHTNALDYLKAMRLAFGGIVTFNFVPRENNPAGHLLAEELKREAPHTA